MDSSDEEVIEEEAPDLNLHSKIFHFQRAIQGGCVGINRPTVAICCVIIEQEIWTCEEFGFVNTWDLDTYLRTTRFRPHKDTITGCALSQKKAVWMASLDGSVSVWSICYDRTHWMENAHDGSPVNGLLHVKPEGRPEEIWSWSTKQKNVCVWNTESCTLSRTISCGELSPVAMCLSPCGIVIGTEEGAIMILSCKSNEEDSKWEGHQGAIRGMAYFQSQQQLWTVSDDCTIKCWSLSPGSTEEPGLVRVLEGHTKPITTITQVGPFFALTGDTTGHVLLWGTSPSLYPASLNSNERLQRLFVVKEKRERLPVRMVFWKECLGRDVWTSCTNNTITVFSLSSEADLEWLIEEGVAREENVKEKIHNWVSHVEVEPKIEQKIVDGEEGEESTLKKESESRERKDEKEKDKKKVKKVKKVKKETKETKEKRKKKREKGNEKKERKEEKSPKEKVSKRSSPKGEKDKDKQRKK